MTSREEMERLAALALAPLVEVAWADGHVSAAERQAVLEAAASCGLGQRDFCQTTLARWLHEPPPTAALAQWRRLLAPTLAASDGRAARATERGLLDAARAVARSDDSPFDIGSGVTDDEARVLRELEEALRGEA